MFINGIMLAGIGGAVVPLVLHLLSRARYRSVDWGAMMFLQGADVRQHNSARLRQIILLVVRMTIVGLLAIALARPIVSGRWELAPEPNVTAVVLIDTSASMGYEEGGRSRLEQAREAALTILATFRKGDRVAILPLGNDDRSIVVPTSDLQSLAAEVSQLDRAVGRVSIAEGLVRARQILESDRNPNREIYLICDHQAASWSGIGESFATIHSSESADRSLRMFVIPVGSRDAMNVAVEDVVLANPPVIRDERAELEITIRNYSDENISSLPVRILSGPRQLRTATIALAPESTSTLRQNLRLREIGSQILSVQISGGGLPADDRFDKVVDVVQPVKVLIVSGDQRDEPFRSEADFLKVALTPHMSLNREGADPAEIRVIESTQLSAVEFDDYQVIVLANLRQLTADQARAIEQYVYDGGGVLVAPGSISHASEYNAALYRDGSGILPASLGPPTHSDGSAPTSILGLELSHPIFRFLRDSAPIPGAVIGRYFPVAHLRADAHVIATFATGDPYLIETPWGRGRVMLMTSPLDADWNTLPVTNFYLPLMQSIVRHLAGGWIADRNIAPGQPIVATFDERIDDRATITRPDGTSVEIPMTRVGPRSEVRHVDTQRPGVYRLRVQKGDQGQVIHYVVRTPSDESDLAPLTAHRWEELQKILGFRRLEAADASLPQMLASNRAGRELFLPLLAAVVALAVVEMILSRLWSRGLRS